MNNVPIDKVSVLEDRKLRIYPMVSSADYQYIYREGREVYWDQNEKCFYSPVPREWNYKKWFSHILLVARDGLGVSLHLTSETKFSPSDSKFVEDMNQSFKEIQNG
jgi:hypothetical protein